jgi:hypothetical protein
MTYTASDVIQAGCAVTETGCTSDWAGRAPDKACEAAKRLVKKFLLRLFDAVGKYLNLLGIIYPTTLIPDQLKHGTTQLASNFQLHCPQ